MKRILWLLLLCATSAWATVGTQSYSVTFTCTGGFGPFPFNFPISAPATLTVTMNGTLLSSANYSIVPVNNNYNNGGSVTLDGTHECLAGWPLILTRVTPVTQAIQFYDNMPIPMKTFERGLDKLTEIAQELDGAVKAAGVGSIQMQNSGINYGVPMTGLGTLNFAGCTVGGTSPSFIITCSAAVGTVTSVSSGNLANIFTASVTNPTTTPAISFTPVNLAADSIFGNFTAGSAAPSTQAIPTCAADGSHAITYASHVLGCTAVGAAGSVAFSGVTNGTNTTAAMVIGNGATLGVTGTGVNNANQFNGNTKIAAGDLSNTAVTPGSYTSINGTVDAQGRLTAASNGSSGGVTSVGLAAPSDLFSISGSPVTTSGTLTFTKQVQNAGYYFRGVPVGVQPANIIQYKKCDYTTANTSFNCVLNAATSQPFILIGIVTDANQTATATDNLGNTYTSDIKSHNGFSETFLHVATSAAGVTSVTVTLTLTSTTTTMYVVELSGLAAVSVTDATSQVGATSCINGTISGGTVTTANNNDIIFGLAANAVPYLYTQVAPWTQIATGTNNGNIGTGLVDFQVNQISSYTPLYGCTSTTDSAAIVAYKRATTPASNLPIFGQIPWLDLTPNAFPGLQNITLSSSPSDTQVGAHVGTHITASDVTTAYAGNNADSTLLTTPTGLPSGYSVSIYVKCNTAVATATVIPAVVFTSDDGSSTVETLSGGTATCTTLGTSDQAYVSQPIHAKANTTIYVKTTLANSPHYNIDAFVEMVSNQ